MTGRTRLVGACAVALGVGLAVPAAAGAHGLVGRADLPVPSWLFGWAAAIVLIASFVALATLWASPRLQKDECRPRFRIPLIVDIATGAIGLGLFVLVVYSGFAGTQQATANFAPTFIYVHFWVGLVVLSVLLGDVFRAFSPWRAAARAAAWGGRRLLGDRVPKPRPYPEWLGRWPAAFGILGFAWLELAYVRKDDPQILAWLALGYAAVQLAGMARFGIDRWTGRADAFGVYYNMFSRLSALDRRGGRLCLRKPLSGAATWEVVSGSVAFLCVAIGSTTFDGFSNGPLWADISPHIQQFFSDLGAGSATAVEWASTVGLVGCVLAIALFYRLGIEGVKTVGENHTARELAGRFVHTLIPIAFAYALAHYFSLLVFQGQAGAYLISDPLGHGSDLFGTASWRINYNVVSTNAIWYVQVGALVTGHVAGLILAHDRALAMYKSVYAASRSQYWMLVVMVGFTSLGLWLLSAVNQ